MHRDLAFSLSSIARRQFSTPPSLLEATRRTFRRDDDDVDEKNENDDGDDDDDDDWDERTMTIGREWANTVKEEERK